MKLYELAFQICVRRHSTETEMEFVVNHLELDATPPKDRVAGTQSGNLLYMPTPERNLADVDALGR